MRTPILLILATLVAACAEMPAQQIANNAIPANEAIDYECPAGTKLVELRDRVYCVDPDIIQKEIERAWDYLEDW